MLSRYFMQVSNVQPTLLQEKETKPQRGFVKYLNKYQRYVIINNYDETIEPTEVRENYYIYLNRRKILILIVCYMSILLENIS